MGAIRSSEPGLCQSALSVLSPNLLDEHDSFFWSRSPTVSGEGRFSSGRDSIRNWLSLQLRTLLPFCNLTTHARCLCSRLDSSTEVEEWPCPARDARISPAQTRFHPGPLW